MTSNRFQFTLASPQNSKSGYITLGDEKIHRIDDVYQFYKALGYTDKTKKSGLLPEEFIWVEYHKDGSKKTEICLQLKIIEYLNKQSAAYKERYAAQFEYWLAKCNDKLRNNTADCDDCA
jgi:hypothetical protein